MILHQAVDSITSETYTWSAETYDHGAGYPGPNSPTNILILNQGPGAPGAPGADYALTGTGSVTITSGSIGSLIQYSVTPANHAYQLNDMVHVRSTAYEYYGKVVDYSTGMLMVQVTSIVSTGTSSACTFSVTGETGATGPAAVTTWSDWSAPIEIGNDTFYDLATISISDIEKADQNWFVEIEAECLVYPPDALDSTTRFKGHCGYVFRFNSAGESYAVAVTNVTPTMTETAGALVGDPMTGLVLTTNFLDFALVRLAKVSSEDGAWVAKVRTQISAMCQL